MKESTRYVIVAFENYLLNDGKKAVELVPRSWVYELEGSNFCKYPPEEDYKYLETWIQENKEPESNWNSFLIKIVKEARDLSQGKRRLKKSFAKDTFSSSDNENIEKKNSEGKESDPAILNEKDVDAELTNIPSIDPSLSDLSSTDPVNKKNKKQKRKVRSEQPSNGQIIAEMEIDAGITLVTQEDLSNLYKKIKKDMNSLRSSIQYDLRQHYNNISNNFIIGGNTSTNTTNNLQTNVLPISTLSEFKEFDQKVQEENEKQKNLTFWMAKHCIGMESFRHAIARILKSLISKEVQLEYTACGRKMKGHKKLNFSETAIYKMMKNIVSERFNDASEQNIQSYTSRWLSGASDREGGRMKRMTESLQIEKEN